MMVSDGERTWYDLRVAEGKIRYGLSDAEVHHFQLMRLISDKAYEGAIAELNRAQGRFDITERELVLRICLILLKGMLVKARGTSGEARVMDQFLFLYDETFRVGADALAEWQESDLTFEEGIREILFKLSRRQRDVSVLS